MKRIILLLLVLLLTACGSGQGFNASDESTGTAAYEGGESAPAPAAPPMEEAAEAGRGDAPSGVVGDSDGTTVQQAQGPAVDRKIVYIASMSLRVDDPRATAQTIQGLARQFGGYVSDVNIYQETETTYRGTVQLRVSAEQFDAALAALRGQASEVLTEQLDSADVTDQFVDLTARIENLTRTETELQVLLTEARERGGRTADILEIYAELTSIREQIEVYQGQLNLLNDSVSLATINVELVPPDAIVEVVDDEWSPLRTVREATRSLTEGLQGLVDGMIFFIVSALPFLLIWGLIGYLLFRLLRWAWRRRPQRPRTERVPTPAPPATPDAS